jgi:hypothetical protein
MIKEEIIVNDGTIHDLINYYAQRTLHRRKKNIGNYGPIISNAENDKTRFHCSIFSYSKYAVPCKNT